MKIGFAAPVAGSWASAENQVHVAQRAEALGYESVWVLHRLLNPVGFGVETYRNSPDPLVTLAFLAGQTSRVRLGTAVVNLPFFSPALLAQQTATLDRVSGGRLDVGVGLGWVPEEFAASGVTMDRRGARADEYLQVLNALWTEDVVEHSGTFYQVPASRLEPKPLQSPRPPLLVGGTSAAAYRRAGRLADGWISPSRFDLTRIGEPLAVIRQAAVDAGRDPAALRFIVRGVVRLRQAGQADRVPLSGSIDEIRQDLAALEAQGITETFVDINFDSEIVGLAVDPAKSMGRAEHLLVELAPSRDS
jgi:probable F420-dependent oxidoreductase